MKRLKRLFKCPLSWWSVPITCIVCFAAGLTVREGPDPVGLIMLAQPTDTNIGVVTPSGKGARIVGPGAKEVVEMIDRPVTIR